jgi:flavin-dependent dehydrogenase
MHNEERPPFRDESQDAASPYDAIVVGAGPAGSTAAYYLAAGMEGRGGKRVALLERATFPRDKYCGDAWCAPALDILEDMGVVQQLEAEGLVGDTTSGGFISPCGESYVSVGTGAGAPGTRCYAIKRIICDERIARRAAGVGAHLYDNAAFATAMPEPDELWTVACRDGRRFRSRMLIAADGAVSRLARSLGVVGSPPQGVASRQYVRGGSHNFKSGGVLFYPKYILPGYVALFRHFDDDIEPRAEFTEPVRVAPLRLGGVERSTAKQFMAVGDAAGQTDPLTGEGIHTGMIGGKLAAQTIHELFTRSDFSAVGCQAYHERWMAAFGRDFRASAMGARLIYQFPVFLDAANVLAQRKGEAFMADFGAAMTGVKPKTIFLRPGVAMGLGIELLRQIFTQRLLRRSGSGENTYGALAVADTSRETAFQNSCLVDSSIGGSHARRE